MTAEATVAPAPTEVKTPAFNSPFLWLIALLALGMLVPLIPITSMAAAIVGAVVLTSAYVVSVVLFSAHLTRLQLPWRYLLIALLASLALWAALQWVTRPALQAHMGSIAQAQGGLPLSWQMVGLLNMNVRSLALMCAGVTGGALVGQIIRTPNMLGPVCAIVALIDIWGVLFGGIVAKLLTNPATQKHAENMMAPMPTVGAASAASSGGFVIPQPAVGVGDFLFLGLLFAALHLNGMNWRGAAKLVTPLVIVALLAVTFGVPALPGLLFIGLGVALPNIKYFQYTREEKFALLYAGIFVVILTAILYFIVMSQLPKNENPLPIRGTTVPGASAPGELTPGGLAPSRPDRGGSAPNGPAPDGAAPDGAAPDGAAPGGATQPQQP